MSNVSQAFTTPVGRIVWGNLYTARPKTDNVTKAPKLGKDGQPLNEWAFGLAIAKGGETHWNQTAWGAKIWAAGQGSFPAGQFQQPTFAWKVTDGDSQIPNKNQKRPCDAEGYPGHWVLSLSTMASPPTIYRLNPQGKPELWAQENAINPGDFVEVYVEFKGNAPAQSPGVYANPSMVCFRGHGPRIYSGPDVSVAAFGGGGALPPGASATPVAGVPMAAPMPAPAVPQAAPIPVAVTPHPGILTPPVPVPAPVAAPPAPVRQMTASAGGASYEQMIAAGWTDALLIQHGHMLP
jgi:hypothetical protein